MIVIQRGSYRATVNPLGASLASLSRAGRELLRRQEGEVGPPEYRGAVLAPWPGRIADGEYEFEATSYRLPISEPARHVALHGLVCNREWEVTGSVSDQVTLSIDLGDDPGYPFSIRLEITYAVSEDAGLVVSLSATNNGDRAAPYGCGFHPYFLPVSGSVDEATVTFGAGTRLVLSSDRLLEVDRVDNSGTELDFSAGRRLGSLVLDHQFTDLARDADGSVVVTLDDLEVRFEYGFEWLQVYTAADRRSFAMEPTWSPVDAFRTGEDIARLAPGTASIGTWSVRLADHTS